MHTLRLLVVSLFVSSLFSGSANAQTLTVLVRDTDKLVISPSDCQSPVRVSWTLNTAVIACSQLRFWVTTDTSCGKEPGASDLELRTYEQAGWGTVTNGEFQFDLADLPGFQAPADGGSGGCGQPNQEIVQRVCAYGEFSQVTACTIQSGSTLPALKPSPIPTVTYDSMPPPPPDISDVLSMDSALGVKLSFDSDDIGEIRVEYGTVESGAFDQSAKFGPDVKTADLENLENGVEYQIRAVATDEAGNESQPSVEARGTPVPTEGFWAAYRRAGGSETGGCAAAGLSVAPAALLVLGLWFRRRQQR